jgi:O-antigen ligase
VTAAAVDVRRAESRGSALLLFLAVFATVATLYKGGNRPLPLMALELAALALLFVLFAARRDSQSAAQSMPTALAVAIGVLLVYPLLQLVPLPAALWSELPGHEPYAAIVARYGDAAPAWRAASLVPERTLASWLALLPPLACLVGMLALSPSNATRLLVWMSVVAGAEGVLGLLQAGAGDMFSFAPRERYGANLATGTFVNKNHLAALLAMMLPVMVALLIRRIRPGHLERRAPAVGESAAQVALLSVSTLVVLVCLVFTRSRAGLATAAIGLAFLFVAVACGRAKVASRGARFGAAWIVAAVGATGAAVAVALVALSGAPVTNRLGPETVSLDLASRVAMYTSTLRAGLEFLPFGSGLGTFPDVYPRFQPVAGPVSVSGFVNHAHNDYLESFMELGIAAPLVVLLLLRAYLGRLWSLVRDDDGRGFTLLQLAAGLSLLPVILHSALDFPLHMPSNAMWFALLAGVVFHARAPRGEPAFEDGERGLEPVPVRAGRI